MPHSHKNSFSIKNAFHSAGHYIRENKIQSSALFTSLLLGTTALVNPALLSPALSTALGSGIMLSSSIALLLQNGEATVQNTLALGNKLGMSAMALGLVIGSLNTVPEVMVSLGAAFRGAIDLGIGNIVGSNIAHTLLILGATAAMAGISKAKDLSWKFNTYVMAGTTAIFGAQLIAATLSPLAGALMLGGGAYFLKNRLSSGKKHEHEHHHEHEHEHSHNHEHHHEHKDGCGEIGACLFHDHSNDEEDKKTQARPGWLNASLAGAGMLGLVAASDMIVRSGISFAGQFNLSSFGLDFGLSEAAIGAVIVAIGTSLPELSINLEAIKKKHSDLAVGNVMGCSIINTLIAGGVLSLTGAPVPDAFNPETTMGMINTGVFMGSAGLLTATLLATKGAIKRWMGAVALAGYMGYVSSVLALSDGKMPELLHQHGHTETPSTETIKTRDLPRHPLSLPSPHH